jgi:SAM-dependent methyltransferase
VTMEAIVPQVRSNVGGPTRDRLEGGCVTPFRQEVNRWWPQLAAAALGTGAEAAVWLDVGCGVGQGHDLLQRAGLRGRYLGVDLAPAPDWEQPDRSGGTLERTFLACDVIHLTSALGASTVDGAMSISAFEHFPDDLAALLAVRTVLRDGAPLLLCVPAPAGRLLWGPRHGYRWYTAKRLRRLTEEAGMWVELVQPLGGAASLGLGLVWFVPAYVLSKLVAVALLVRHGGRRGAARRRHPWSAHLVTRIQFAHCGTARGRRLHQRVVALVNRLDGRARTPASAWAAVIRKPANAGAADD